MIVYRVEHREGRFGPYLPPPFALTPAQEAVRAATMEKLDGSAAAHPSPYSDGLGELTAAEYACFTSYEQLLAWFGEEALHRLTEIGFTVCTYAVASELVREGGRQAVFPRSAAERQATAVTAPWKASC